MTRIRNRRPSPAMVVALCALFVAASGTTYAAIKIPKNSITSKHLKNGKAVKGVDVVDRSLSGADVTDGSLLTADLGDNAVTGAKVANDALTGDDIAESTLGSVPSADSATQLAGKSASSYISSIVIRRKDLTPLANASTTGGAGDGSANDGTVQCQASERAIGGGVRIAQAGVDQAVSASRPVDASGLPADGSTAPTGWRGVASDSGGVAGNNPSDVQVFVVCAS